MGGGATLRAPVEEEGVGEEDGGDGAAVEVRDGGGVRAQEEAEDLHDVQLELQGLVPGEREGGEG